MGDWPREVYGHTIARKVDFRRSSGDVEEDFRHTFQCVGCGHQFDGLDDPRLRTLPCNRLVRDWSQ